MTFIFFYYIVHETRHAIKQNIFLQAVIKSYRSIYFILLQVWFHVQKI